MPPSQSVPRYKVFANPWAQVAISALSVTIAELFQKKGAMATAHLSQRWGWDWPNDSSVSVRLGRHGICYLELYHLVICHQMPASLGGIPCLCRLACSDSFG